MGRRSMQAWNAGEPGLTALDDREGAMFPWSGT